MANTVSKKPEKAKKTTKTTKTTSKNVVKITTPSKKGSKKSENVVKNTTLSDKSSQKNNKFTKFFHKLRTKYQKTHSEHYHPHKSFRRSYREDYARDFETPGLLTHAITTFKIIFRNWRTFLPFIAIMVVLYIVLVGLMSEDFYKQFQDSINETNEEIAASGREIGNFAKAGLLLLSTITTGGLETGSDEVQIVFIVLLFLIMWLVTIYLIRNLFSGRKLKLREALYNALAPLISTILVFVVIFLQAIPAMLVAITYSAAVATGFLDTPFYALIYFIFAALMILLSVYMLSSSLIALTAVTAPGLYPMAALHLSSGLISGRRTRLVLRAIYLLLVVVIIYAIVMLPVIMLDLWLKSSFEWLSGWPIVPFFLLAVTCFVFIYATIYIYRYYRWLLEYKEPDTKPRK